MSTHLIIPASGIGLRFGGNIPKQYTPLTNNRTILDTTLSKFINEDITTIVLAISKTDTWWQQSEFYNHPKICTILGGEERFHSVYNALLALQDIAHPDDLIAVHDAVRPLIEFNEVAKLIAHIGKNPVGGLLVAPSVNSLKKIEHNTLHNINRDSIFQALTPQIYRFSALQKALEHSIKNNIPITDEAAAIEALGLHSLYLISEQPNPKITTTYDVILVNALLEAKTT